MLFLLFVFTSFLVFSQSCKCIPPSIERSFCSTDVVAHITVHNVTINGTSQIVSESVYDVNYVKIYKGADKLDMVQNKNAIYTPPTGGTCGVAINYHNHPNWLIFGNVNQRKLSIHSCDANRQWSDGVEKEMDNLIKKNNCTIAK